MFENVNKDLVTLIVFRSLSVVSILVSAVYFLLISHINIFKARANQRLNLDAHHLFASLYSCGLFCTDFHRDEYELSPKGCNMKEVRTKWSCLVWMWGAELHKAKKQNNGIVISVLEY